jgi:GNAT superfamily N-acetyltransferase
MRVRPREAADLPACVQALTEVYRCDGYPQRWPAAPAAWLDPPGLVAAWVADLDGVVAGHVALVGNIAESQAATVLDRPLDQLAKVSRLYVAPPGRGRGAGRALLDAASSSARQRGLSLVLDVVDASLGATAFYDRLGWRLLYRRLADWTTDAGERPLLRVYAAP